MTPCYARILLLAMFAGGLALVGAVTAFLVDQMIVGVICLLVSMILSLSFLEYTCVRHHIASSRVTDPPPSPELSPPSPSIEVVTAQP